VETETTVVDAHETHSVHSYSRKKSLISQVFSVIRSQSWYRVIGSRTENLGTYDEVLSTMTVTTFPTSTTEYYYLFY
jgi:hypothetical protein